MQLNIDQLIQTSINWRRHTSNWRRDTTYQASGVVILFNDEVQGWCNELRDPDHWLPGCVPIDVHGVCWQALGGTEYFGAKRWQMLNVK